MFKRKKKSENQKVRNATKVEFDGIKFDSKFELFFYKKCKEHNVNIQLKPKYLLLPKFEYNNEKFREMAMFPDFYLIDYDIIVETKGFPNETFPLKHKLLMYHLLINSSKSTYVILKTQKEVIKFFNNLKLNE